MKSLLLIAGLAAVLGTVKRGAPGEVRATGGREGRYLTYHADGRVATERFYHQGRETGTHRGWYANGAPKFEYLYRDGLSEGAAREWDTAGKMIREAHFKNGHEDGQQRLWDGQGRLRANYVMRDGIRYGRFGALGCKGTPADTLSR